MSDILEQGYAGILIRVFDEENREVIEGITKLTYTHSEKADDASIITIQGNNPSLVDNPALQEDRELNIVFGYTSGKRQRRKVWIFDIKPDYSENGITLSLSCYCKAAYLKQNASDRVWNNSTLEEQAKSIADAHQLKFENQLTVEYENYKNQSNQYARDDEGNLVPYVYNARDATARPTLWVFDRKNEPQAGGSDYKAIQKALEVEGIPNLVIEGRDDKLIMRQRNLKQAPYKSLSYKSEPGNILKFYPQTNNQLNKKYGLENTTTGWDAENKVHITTKQNKESTGEAVLGDSVPLGLYSAKEKEALVSDEENSILGTTATTVEGTYTEVFEGVDASGREIYRRDFTGDITENQVSYTGFVKKGGKSGELVLGDKKVDSPSGEFNIKTAYKLQDIESTTVQVRGFVINQPGEIVRTAGETTKQIASEGTKRVSDKDMEMNTATATVIGDPELVSGKIVTINGVGRKFGGNWYIASAKHELDDNGYITILELMKNSLNKIEGESDARVKPDTLNGIEFNNGIATDGTEELRQIPLEDD